MKNPSKVFCLSVQSILLLTVFAGIMVGCAETVSIRRGPPPLPVYEQPYCPGPGYMWVPGYWAYGPDGYFWVPGMWEYAPRMGWMWTPGYWGWSDGFYCWHSGYWGRHVGFYGGVNYGWGYNGSGYAGGYWRENVFYYNRAETRVNVTVVNNTYTGAAVMNKTAATSASYNGGSGGTTVTPTSRELAVAREPHIGATPNQKRHFTMSSANPELRAANNHGQPRADLLVRSEAYGTDGKVAGTKSGVKKNKRKKIKKQEQLRQP